jgi:hypothetical protein
MHGPSLVRNVLIMARVMVTPIATLPAILRRKATRTPLAVTTVVRRTFHCLIDPFFTPTLI